MPTAILTPNGRITIPAEVRKQLGLQPGDQIDFVVEDGTVRLVRRQERIEAIFGLCKADVSVSDENMERTIRQRAGR